MKEKALIVIHLLLVILAYSAWAWLDYRILAVLAIAHLIMLETLRGCPLSHAQFPEDKDKRFYEWWLGKLGVRPNERGRRKLRIFMQYILPFVIIALAVVAQVLFGLDPLLSL